MTCQYFEKCGGCTAQHIPYELQLENKRKLVERIVQHPVNVYSAAPFGYRNRMDFVFSKDGLALRKKGDWKTLIPVAHCPISNEGVNRLLGEVQDWFSRTKLDVFDISSKHGTLRYCVIRHTKDDSSLGFIINADSTKVKEAVDAITLFSSTTSAGNVIIGYVPSETDVSNTEDYFVVKGKEDIIEELLGRAFSFNVQGFFQNNTTMAERMVQFVKETLTKEQTANATLLDLYGGVGLFGISLADKFRHVHVVENFAGSIASAKKNAELNHVQINAVVGDAANAYKLPLRKPLYVITDPPRSGMHSKAIERLLALQPSMIIYISCNPEQLGKELPKFLKHYSLADAAMFDLFPQTLHVECIVVLKANVANPQVV
ncbi:MAG: 23S rRNA (uracil(1939)-C(5))-methyltransferase RlmD [archaeon]